MQPLGPTGQLFLCVELSDDMAAEIDGQHGPGRHSYQAGLTIGLGLPCRRLTELWR
jgi:hypothetical protein